MAVGLYSGVSGLALGIGLYRNVSGLWGGASGLINGFGGADPYAGASLYLNFLDPTLDSRITFSRGTNATLIDSTGKLTYAPNNPVLWSEDFTNGVWNPAPQGSASAAVVTADAGVAPNGTLTADRIQFSRTGTTSTDRSRVVQSTIPLSTSTDYVFSIWLKSFSGSNQTVTLFPNFGLGSSIAVTVTSEWQRFAVTANSSASATGQFVIGLGYVTNTVTSADVLVWGAQLEQVTYQTTPGTYNATTASAYYGPRFDYDPVTLAPRGLLIEEARTNLLTYSGAVGGTSWSASNATPTLNSILAPDGTTTATLITENTAATPHAIFGTSSTLTATAHTASVYIKAGTRRYVSVRGETTAVSVYAWVTLDTQTGSLSANASVTSASAVNAGNGWWRVIMTWANTQVAATGANMVIAGSDVATAPATSSTLGNSYTGTSATFYAWGAQLEAGGFATSYIPTVASTVTRNADVATMTGTNFSSWYNQPQGTFVTDFSRFGFDAVAGSVILTQADDGTTNNRVALRLNSRVADASAQATIVSGGSVLVNAGAGTLASMANRIVRATLAYQVGTPAVGRDGSVGDVAAVASLPTVNQLSIGQGAGAAAVNGHIRTIAYFNTRLPNAQLQTLTAPSLATTLSLDFTSGSYNVGF